MPPMNLFYITLVTLPVKTKNLDRRMLQDFYIEAEGIVVVSDGFRQPKSEKCTAIVLGISLIALIILLQNSYFPAIFISSYSFI